MTAAAAAAAAGGRVVGAEGGATAMKGLIAPGVPGKGRGGVNPCKTKDQESVQGIPSHLSHFVSLTLPTRRY